MTDNISGVWASLAANTTASTIYGGPLGGDHGIEFTAADERTAVCLIGKRHELLSKLDEARAAVLALPAGEDEAPPIDPPALRNLEWREIGDAAKPGGTAARLSAQVAIEDVLMHVHAYQVEMALGWQQSLQDDEEMARHFAAAATGDPWETATIPGFEGREYVIVATPHS